MTTNNTFNDSVTVNSVRYHNTPGSAITENEFGESSREIVFWTKPEGR